MSKRGNGEGSPHKRKDGYWAWPVMLDGARKWVYGKTKAEAREKYEARKREHEEGLDTAAADQTVGEYLDRWMEDVVRSTLRARTADEYASLIRMYIKPALGEVILRELKPQVVQRMIKNLPAHLAPRSIRNVRAVLRRALNNALVWRLVTYNAATGIALPKVQKFQARIPTTEEAAAFRAAIAGDRIEALYLIAMYLGLRRGEALGLLKSDVDLENRELHITGQVQLVRGEVKRVTTKTEASKRTLPIFALLVPYLEQTLQEQPDNTLLFPSENGNLIRPRNLIVAFKRRLTKAGLPDTIRFHDLRHFAATTMLTGGADISSTQALLGHTDAATTLNFYAHAIPSRTRDVVEDVVGKAFSEGIPH